MYAETALYCTWVRQKPESAYGRVVADVVRGAAESGLVIPAAVEAHDGDVFAAAMETSVETARVQLSTIRRNRRDLRPRCSGIRSKSPRFDVEHERTSQALVLARV